MGRFPLSQCLMKSPTSQIFFDHVQDELGKRLLSRTDWVVRSSAVRTWGTPLLFSRPEKNK